MCLKTILSSCTYNYEPVAVVTFDIASCPLPSNSFPVFQPFTSEPFENTDCLNRVLRSSYMYYSGLGVVQRGSDTTSNLFYVLPPLNINISNTPAYTIEIWLSVEINPLPDGKYVIFNTDEVVVSLVQATVLCMRRFILIETPTKSLEVDLILWVANALIEENTLIASAMYLNVVIGAGGTLLCIGIPLMFKPLCFQAVAPVMQNTINSVIFPYSENIIAIYHIGVYLGAIDTTMLFDYLLFVSKKPVISFS